MLCEPDLAVPVDIKVPRTTADGRNGPLSHCVSIGIVPTDGIRDGHGEPDFARLIGVSVRTLQNWEQGHRQPTGPAAALLRAVKADPKAVIKALHEA